jgi:DNA-binding transcriptional ArsR family regulator
MGAAAAVHVIDDVAGGASVLHPMRLRLLSELGEPDSAAGLARRLGLPRQQINYHLRLLEERGLIEVVGEQRKRGCTERLVRAVARSYVISPGTLGTLATDPSRIQDRFSSSYLIAVAAQVIRDVAALRDRADRAARRLPTLTLQTEVRVGSAEAQHAFAEELAREVARIAAKYHDAEAPNGRRLRVLATAYPVPVASGA